MAVLEWDKVGERIYQTGVDKGVLFVMDSTGNYGNGVAWSGLSNVTESPSGAEATAIYADNIKYLDLISKEDFGGTIEAYTFPDEWAECDGSATPVAGLSIGQQSRKAFGFAFRTLVGNDSAGTDYGYKIHLVYNAKATPSERAFATVNDSPEAISFSWTFTTTPVNVSGYKPASNITIDTTKLEGGVNNEKLKQLEAMIYGSAEKESTLPTIDEVITLFGASTSAASVSEDGEG